MEGTIISDNDNTEDIDKLKIQIQAILYYYQETGLYRLKIPNEIYNYICSSIY